ncbi:MAG TPA: ABC transporter substrate-binding protein [Mycobacteriales bacterium]|nr:ABC transporter substrate-binding protein [Mycobacteriales bacterium]
MPANRKWTAVGAAGRGRKGRPAAAALALPALVLAGCTGANDVTKSDASSGGILRMGVFAENIQTLDPHQATSGTDRQIVGRIFNGLVRFRPGDFTAPVEPDLATAVPEPKTNPDGTQTWTFALRAGVKCQAGPKSPAYDLTADDVVYSYQRSGNADTSAFASDHGDWKSVTAVDPRTVAITLTAPSSRAVFLPKVAAYAGGFVVCKKAVQAEGDKEFATHPVGTGPFVMGEYKPGDGVSLTPNADYFRGKPKLTGVKFRFLPDDTTRDLALDSGEVDLIWGQPEQQWLDRTDAKDGITAVAFPVEGTVMISLRMDKPPFNDKRVREAVVHAIDRKQHTAIGGDKVATAIWSIVNAAGVQGGLSEADTKAAGLDLGYDPDESRRLLADAGHAHDIKFDVVSSTLAVYKNNYQILQSELAAVGITMTIKSVDHPTMHTLIRKGQNALTVYDAPRPTMDVLLTQFVNSASVVVGGSAPVTNFSFYRNRDVDGWLGQARAASDPAAQAELWRKVNRQVLADAAVIPLYVGANTFAYRDNVAPAFKLVATIDNSWPIDETTAFAS